MSLNIPKIEGLSEHQVMTLIRARKYRQYLDMIESYRADECLFCDPLGPKNEPLHTVAGWRVWENPFPEPNTALHLVLASVRHIASEDEITVNDFTAIGELFTWAKEHYSDVMKGGGLLMRFGSPELNAGTILHLHANIMVPNLEGEVRLPLAKTPEKHNSQLARMLVFEKVRLGAKYGDLSPEEEKVMEESCI